MQQDHATQIDFHTPKHRPLESKQQIYINKNPLFKNNRKKSEGP